jgi:DNA-binding PadR family transcriptional regulator
MKNVSSEKLTTPDLVVLSLLAERPMHGYEANTLLEFRKVRDWAGISRPQVYYSLDKLARRELVRSARGDSDGKAAGGPERNVYETTARGRTALADALERDDWTDRSEHPAFLTWLALSWQCLPGIFLKQAGRRRKFLELELTRKQEILAAVRKEVGHRFHEAVWMLSLNIDQLRTELGWIGKIVREFPKRSAARNPDYLAK